MPRVAVGVACAIMLVLLAAVVGISSWDTREAARTRAEEALGNLALSLERGLVRHLAMCDAILQGLAGEHGVGGETTALRALAQPGWLPFLRSVTVIDAVGRVRQSSGAPPSDPDMARRSDFRAHLESPDLGLIVGEIVPATQAHPGMMQLSRRIDLPGGGFGGIVSATVDVAELRRGFDDFRLGPGGTVALLSLDGLLVAASPMRDSSVGMDLGRSAVMERLRSAGPGLFKAVSIVDGKERLYSALKLQGLPFYLVVGTSTAGVYRDWSARAWASAGMALMFLVLLAVVVDALRRELRQRQRAETDALARAAEARASTEAFDVVCRNTDDLIMKVDWDGTRRFVSAASERLIGYDPGALMGRNALTFVHPDDAPLLSATLDSMRQGLTPTCHVTYRLRHRDGTWRSVEARGRALPDGTGAIVVVRDVSERMALENKLRQAQRMEAVGQLTAGVAHDFNNMLQGQIAGLELLMDEIAGQGRAMELAELAISAGEKGARLTHSLLAFSRQQVLRPEAVDLDRLCAELTLLLSRTLDPRVTVSVEIEAGLAAPFADRAQLEAALLNLCLNARDAMKERGGRIVIEAYAGAVTPGAGQGLDNRDCVVVAVSDEGAGMSADVLAKVCEPFFTTKKPGEGSGLGLSMVQGFARQSGGELRLQSWPGAGTRVQIWLPAAPAGPVPVADVARRPARPGPARHVLLVDDDEMVRTMLRSMLQGAGLTVSTAAGGAEALSILGSDPGIDALVTDYGMPGMTGGELVARAAEVRPGLPALVVTGYAEALLLGKLPNDAKVLCKPFRVDELIQHIDALPAGQAATALDAVE